MTKFLRVNAQEMQIAALVAQVRALQQALLKADDLEAIAKDAGSLLTGEGAYNEMVDRLTKARSRYRVARRKVPL